MKDGSAPVRAIVFSGGIERSRYSAVLTEVPTSCRIAYLAVWKTGQYTSSSLRSRLQDHVERRLSGSPYAPKTTSADDLPQLRLAGLRPECSADILRQ